VYEGWSGTIDGTVAGTWPDTQFVGTVDLIAPAATGRGACAGRAVFSGRSASNSLRWETTRLTIAPDADGHPVSACRGLLRNVVLILGR
jgi:hypothetical protein